jgi:hypothetical protein
MIAGIIVQGLKYLLFCKKQMRGGNPRCALCVEMKQVGCALDATISSVWLREAKTMRNMIISMLFLKKRASLEI